MTRSGDYDLAVPNASYRKRSDLQQRANMINDSNCDMYLSIHLNAFDDPYYSGAQVYYDDVNANNIKIANVMQTTLKKTLNTKREYKQLTDRYMYKRVNIQGVLIEAGFLSNYNERYLLKTKSYQEKIADSITVGVINYYK